jgi:Tol biopolymer transport system component
METAKMIRWAGILLLAAVSICAPEAKAQFGKNKVQYQDFNWKYIQSKHFDIYFYQNGEYLAKYTAIEAERALESIERTLSYTLSKRVALVVYNSHNEFQQTNVINEFLPEGVGGVTELFKNRVVVPFEGKYDQYRHVVHHELVHAVLNDMFYGGSFQNAISNNVRASLPLWMNEGFSEYESQGGYDTETDMFMRDVTLSEYVQGFQNLNGYFAYRGGQAFYWWVSEKYGKGKVGELINRVKSVGDIDGAYKATFGLTYEEMSEKWAKEMKKFYWPDIEKYEDPEDYASRITNHKKTQNFYNSSPAISPDGEKMAFISDRDGQFGVYVMNLRAKETEADKIISSGRSSDFEDLNLLTPGISWDPTGRKLVVSAKAGGEDALYIIDVETEDYERKKLGFTSISSAAWSPDGKYIAFIGHKDENPDIHLYNVQTGSVENITNDIFTDSYLTWAPDSKRIYFLSDRGGFLNTSPDNYPMWEHDEEQSDIYEVDITGRTISRITNTPQFKKTSIAPSPDGTKLLYVSDDNGIGNLYELTFSTGAIRPLTNSLSAITQLSLARDASKLLFTSQTGGGYDIFQLRFPFERNVNYTQLPLTKYRQRLAERDSLTRGITQGFFDDSTETRDSTELTGYGNFDLDFSRQQSVEQNADVPNSPGTVASTTPADTSFAVRDYKVTFTPDLILSNANYNTFFGVQAVTQMLFSDILGDHQIFFQANLLLDLKNSNFLLAYSYLPEIIDYQVSGFHNVGFVERRNGLLYRFRYYGAEGAASFPFDRFNRVEWGLRWMNMTREHVLLGDEPLDPTVLKTVFMPQARFVHDDVLFGYYAPIDGNRSFLAVEGSPKFSENTLGFATVTTDVRQYVQFSGLTGLAFRFAGGASFGPNPQRFIVGGTENWINRDFNGNFLPFDEPEDFAFLREGVPLRGWRVNERNGTKYFVTNAEFRFPLIQALVTGGVPLLFQAIMGGVFFDMGGAWNTIFVATQRNRIGEVIPRDLLMSAGVGLRTYALGLPIKFDVAWRNEYHTWSEPYYLFSLGGDF